jgi:hypothetical protein
MVEGRMDRQSGRRVVSGLATVALVVAAALGAASVSTAAEVADPAPALAQGCSPRLSVSKTAGLAPSGETVTVSGSCFDVAKGVYVAFCVVPPPGTVPSPCGGGVDMSGANGLSHWISSNPPPQGIGLTTPYGAGGTFTVTMRPSSQLNATVDCRRVSCAIVTRNDHTRSSDRSQDVIVPVSFAADPAPAPTAPALPALPDLSGLASLPAVGVGPEAGGTTTVPGEEATTTTEAPVSTSTSTTAAAAPDDDELAADPLSSEGGGSAVPVVVVVLGAVVLVAVAGGGWWALRRRPHDPDGSAS